MCCLVCDFNCFICFVSPPVIYNRCASLLRELMRTGASDCRSEKGATDFNGCSSFRGSAHFNPFQQLCQTSFPTFLPRWGFPIFFFLNTSSSCTLLLLLAALRTLCMATNAAVPTEPDRRMGSVPTRPTLLGQCVQLWLSLTLSLSHTHSFWQQEKSECTNELWRTGESGAEHQSQGEEIKTIEAKPGRDGGDFKWREERKEAGQGRVRGAPVHPLPDPTHPHVLWEEEVSKHTWQLRHLSPWGKDKKQKKQWPHPSPV